jgi:hypothetical protein
MHPILKDMRSLLASQDALPTHNAARRIELDFLPGTPPLWIVAPEAVQGTTFEKDRGAYARSIMYGETLDVKYPPDLVT